jgi:hypothetical protein
MKIILSVVIFAAIILGGYYAYQSYSAEEQGDKNLGDSEQIAKDYDYYKSLSLEERFKICDSLASGSSISVTIDTTLFVNLPEDIYPFENRELIENGAQAGLLQNGENLYNGEEFAANKCATHRYAFSGIGEVTLMVRSTDNNALDYSVKFLVNE